MPKRYVLTAIFKLVLIISLFLGVSYGFVYTYFYITKGRGPRVLEISPKYSSRDVVILPYTTKSYAGYGRVFEPEIELTVVGDNKKELRVTFLLDSGAVVSTLPIGYADSLGKDIEDAQRIVLRGFGNQRSFGYMSNMTILVDNKKVNIPVVFSEGETTKKILGRNGFFDQFTIIFDHKDKVIRLAK